MNEESEIDLQPALGPPGLVFVQPWWPWWMPCFEDLSIWDLHRYKRCKNAMVISFLYTTLGKLVEMAVHADRLLSATCYRFCGFEVCIHFPSFCLHDISLFILHLTAWVAVAGPRFQFLSRDLQSTSLTTARDGTAASANIGILGDESMRCEWVTWGNWGNTGWFGWLKDVDNFLILWISQFESKAKGLDSKAPHFSTLHSLIIWWGC